MGMIVFQVQTSTMSYKETNDLYKALEAYENAKDFLMADEPNEDTYVELVFFTEHDDFDDGTTLRREVVGRDEARLNDNPRDEGFDFDYWAAWHLVTE